mmetsp:Transcript_48514/g.161867  ORF Transcript_48514/g.161867 Transcript_48514/m.161867 type:complete len:330 (-) Transcript_48514:121-1110(-)
MPEEAPAPTATEEAPFLSAPPSPPADDEVGAGGGGRMQEESDPGSEAGAESERAGGAQTAAGTAAGGAEAGGSGGGSTGGSGGGGGGMAGDAPPGLPSAAAPKGPPEAATAPAPPRAEAPLAAPAPAASGGRTVSFSCSSCAKKLLLRLSASQLASPTPITCSCSSCGSVLKINLPPSNKAKPLPPRAAAPGPSSLRPPPAPKPAKGGAAPSAAPKTVERTFQCSCVSCGAKLRFTLSCSPNACTASTKCAMCHAELRVRIPSLKPPAPGADPSPGASSERTRAWACGVRDAAFAEEEREDTEAPLPLPEALLHWAESDSIQPPSLHST